MASGALASVIIYVNICEVTHWGLSNQVTLEFQCHDSNFCGAVLL